MWYIYVLRCRDNSLYTGITNNLKKRLATHRRGEGGAYTQSHKPEKFVHTESVPTRSEALKREHEIKSWTRKKKIHILRLAIKKSPEVSSG